MILPAEADAAILAGEQTAVADCYAMGVAAEIVKDLPVLSSCTRAKAAFVSSAANPPPRITVWSATSAFPVGAELDNLLKVST